MFNYWQGRVDRGKVERERRRRRDAIVQAWRGHEREKLPPPFVFVPKENRKSVSAFRIYDLSLIDAN